jgi:hypothetical protein
MKENRVMPIDIFLYIFIFLIGLFFGCEKRTDNLDKAIRKYQQDSIIFEYRIELLKQIKNN